MHERGSSGGGFFNGLVIGAVIGAGAYFLLGTKTGKKVLKAVSEQGFDNLEGVIGAVTESMSCDCDGECDCVEDMPASSAKTTTAEEAPKKSSRKRFFKGIKK